MANKRLTILAIATISYTASAFQAPIHSVAHTQTTPLFSSVPGRTDGDGSPISPPLSTLVNRVAVAGATGRTGKYVVQQLLDQNVPVLAMVRDVDKAANVLDPTNELLTIRQTDLGNKDDVIAALSDGGEKCEAAIWCATGFSDAPDQSIMDKLKAVFGLAVNAAATIDAVGLPALGEGLAHTPKRTVAMGSGQILPKVIMLSSAGVTRPDWNEEKKLALEGSAGIPIVRLNPFGILGVKKESEEKLRTCGVEYCIFRPCGLNDSWSPNQRPIFSQGDVAVGRINRQDVAKILVDILSTPEATGKTFEGISIANSQGYYPPASSIGPALGRLALDSDNNGKGPSEEVVRATYAICQQLLPGEKQDAAQLAMGQTYEQLDKDETGRLGVKGEEDVGSAGLTSTS
mmetsp:Transcript_19302/g.41911  ORF Transcript_19302/g.41911 Transcript_19302/m.41911 type:complete len:403 (-) Transcript_19302:308-1516(-)|eukprot:CAMPEP_0172299248 /NCGR_PEP_ID=MMETSP1058-20130122/1606_1 /TAXON_ID=83371 /ORGANISM="Detonula confervacea, Strain CCMP 353" /LENGTH=402 /DNA_ID=CAMNT_0013008637 /DNA_START=55 /DNA_END=1263 /DNA_ORIENTATION=+